MPPNFRLLVLGPKGAGVKTQASRLQEFYGWRVVNFLEIV
jgi:adenylate kinase family enzyme